MRLLVLVVHHWIHYDVLAHRTDQIQLLRHVYLSYVGYSLNQVYLLVHKLLQELGVWVDLLDVLGLTVDTVSCFAVSLEESSHL